MTPIMAPNSPRSPTLRPQSELCLINVDTDISWRPRPNIENLPLRIASATSAAQVQRVRHATIDAVRCLLRWNVTCCPRLAGCRATCNLHAPLPRNRGTAPSTEHPPTSGPRIARSGEKIDGNTSVSSNSAEMVMPCGDAETPGATFIRWNSKLAAGECS